MRITSMHANAGRSSPAARMSRERPSEGSRRARVRGLPAIWEQLVVATGGVVLHSNQHIAEVVDRIDAVLLAGGDERVEDGEVVPRARVTDKEEIGAAECDAAERGLRDIVVGRDRGVAEEAAEG